jgi:Asp-tRNA(Asn)/Glu-tRNA(Gln) amidotransferase B subunit
MNEINSPEEIAKRLIETNAISKLFAVVTSSKPEAQQMTAIYSQLTATVDYNNQKIEEIKKANEDLLYRISEMEQRMLSFYDNGLPLDVYTQEAP